jgi:hypothetical protein
LYPDFLGIGAQKAGTTWLGRNLQAHPEVWMPRVKEVHYFDEKIHESRNTTLRLVRRIFGASAANRRWRRQVRRRARKHLRRFSRKDFSWDLNYYVGAPGDGWYASLFEPGRGRIIGEITPAYSTLAPDDVYRVHQLAPNARIVFMMRNPMERVWSQAVMSLDRSKGKAIDAVTEEEFLRIFNGEGSRRRTDYLLTLDTWSAFYPKDRIFVGFLEDVRFFPEELLRAVYDFLGVDPTFRPPRAGSKVHTRSTGSVPAVPLAHLARSYSDEISALCERFGGYASFWRFCAERLAGTPPAEEHLPYPLWESRLWKQWPDSGQIRLQSGPLPSVRVAR